MLTIIIKDQELFNEETNEFTTVKGQTLQLEHSLVSISKWEAKWKKAFLKKDDRSTEEVLDYVKCMTVSPQNVRPEVYRMIDSESIKKIQEYIDDPMTATWFNAENNEPGRETVTSELIYYWMIALNIPFECQKWHLNRLLTLVKVCNIKNGGGKKKSREERIADRKALNAQRRAASHSKG